MGEHMENQDEHERQVQLEMCNGAEASRSLPVGFILSSETKIRSEA